MDEDLENYKKSIASKTKGELFEILEHIDKDKYPERYEYVKSLFDQHPGVISEIESGVIGYSTFGERLVAKIIDGIIFLPIFICLWLLSIKHLEISFLMNKAFGILFLFFYSTYFLVRFGATFGKSHQNLKVITIQNGKVTWGEAFLRNAIDYVYIVLSAFAGIVGFYKIPLDERSGLNIFSVEKAIRSYQPKALSGVVGLISMLIIADLIVFFCNRKHRALHDYIAGTVVISSPTKISFHRNNTEEETS